MIAFYIINDGLCHISIHDLVAQVVGVRKDRSRGVLQWRGRAVPDYDISVGGGGNGPRMMLSMMVLHGLLQMVPRYRLDP